MSWIAAGTAILGTGASLYGANKQAKANSAAQASNERQQAEQNRLAWANYLMTRGIDPAGAQTGVVPSSGRAINSRLPLWANVRHTGAGKYVMPSPGGSFAQPPEQGTPPGGGRTWSGLGIQRNLR